MHCFAIQFHWPDAATDESARFNRAAQTHEANVIAIVDLEFSCELGRHFDKHLRLQFGKMTQETCHPAGGVMLGQPVCCENVRKVRITRRRETIFSACKPVHHRIRIARIERVSHGRFQRFEMRRERAVLQIFRDVHPAQAILVQDKWRVAAVAIQTAFVTFRPIIWMFSWFEIGNIDTGPFF